MTLASSPSAEPPADPDADLGPDVLYGVALGETQEPFLQIGLGRAVTWATRTAIVSGTRWVRIRVRLAQTATVTTVLRDNRGRRLASRTDELAAGTTYVRLRVPKAARRPGRYALEVTATCACGEQLTVRATLIVLKARFTRR